MSRVHKYRAYDKKEKRMLEVCGLFWDINETNVVELDTIDPSTPYYELEHRIEDVELMEFTGKSDKNNNEIYEYDIIRDKEGRIYLVRFGIYEREFKEFIMSGIGWHLERLQSPEKDYPGLVKGENLEIIGNIFENPEYLGESL